LYLRTEAENYWNKIFWQIIICRGDIYGR
jgi:hypothetical protein